MQPPYTMSTSKLGNTPMTTEENVTTLHDITAALADLIGKVDDNSTHLIELGDVIATVQADLSAEVATVKADQGHLHATINNV
jgi:hypothetical protein